MTVFDGKMHKFLEKMHDSEKKSTIRVKCAGRVPRYVVEYDKKC
jgi:hypothetical protein